jgi:hypothetical protein
MGRDFAEDELEDLREGIRTSLVSGKKGRGLVSSKSARHKIENATSMKGGPGNPGSGNWGHAGIPGHYGGSQPTKSAKVGSGNRREAVIPAKSEPKKAVESTRAKPKPKVWGVVAEKKPSPVVNSRFTGSTEDYVNTRCFQIGENNSRVLITDPAVKERLKFLLDNQFNSTGIDAKQLISNLSVATTAEQIELASFVIDGFDKKLELSVQKYGEDYRKTGYEVLMGIEEGVRGFVDESTKVMAVHLPTNRDGTYDFDTFDSIFNHEFGHSILASHPDGKINWQARFDTMADFDRKTPYSETNYGESFAETYKAYTAVGGRKRKKTAHLQNEFSVIDGIVDGMVAIQRTSTKGGPGSGNWHHAGIPGHLGGSAPEGGAPASHGIQPGMELGISMGQDKKSAFNEAEWTAMDIGGRKKKFFDQSIEEQDALADAQHSIPGEISKRLAFAGPNPNTGDARADISTRLKSISRLVPKDSIATIENTCLELHDALEQAGASPEAIHKLTQAAVDALVVQEHESLSRQLGDHGINHIRGDIDMAMGMLKVVPGAETPSQIAEVYTSCIFHDTGYLTKPSQLFMDEGHERWSQEHFDENVRPLVEEALGNRSARRVSTIIGTHSESSIDWEKTPVESAVRTADNLALFSKEKLPAVFRYSKENLSLLEDYATGKISLGAMQSGMKSNIQGMAVSPEIKSQLMKAVGEMHPRTPKFTLGMTGGSVDGFEWVKSSDSQGVRGGYVRVYLRKNQEATRLNKVLDLGQRAFAKLAESYKVDWRKFRNSLAFDFPPKESGSTVLQGVMVGEKEFDLMKLIDSRLRVALKSRNGRR